MHLLQRAKKTSVFRHPRIRRFAFTFTFALLFSATLSLFGSMGIAQAASSNAQSTSVRSATSGGGCGSNTYLEACISVNSAGEVEPDTYILQTTMCSVTIKLYRDHALYTSKYDQSCYEGGTHLYGDGTDADAGHTWQTSITGLIIGSGNSVEVASPYQYT